MYRLAFFLIVLLANTAAFGQLAMKPQVPSSEPFVREAFMPNGGEGLLSYPMDAKLDGKPVWFWKYHKRKLADLDVTNALGQKLTEDQILEALQKPTIVLVSRELQPVHAYYLKVIKHETLVIVDKIPADDGGKNPGSKK